MFTRIAAFACLIALFTSAAPAQQPHHEPWRIVSAADWHSSEGGVLSRDPAVFEKNQAEERLKIRGTVACRPDVVLIAGDVGSGHWTRGALEKANAIGPNETIEQAIHRLGERAYRSMKNNFAAAGVDRLFLCVGDHGIGDNDWPAGSERAKCVPYHREIWGRSYNTDARGNWLWPETVCDTPARPLGTKYEKTSFAARHKNVLFVQADIFHQEDPDQTLHPRHGSVNPDLEGKHLAWFDAILKAGRSDVGIKYIFVQAHTPALPPIRGQSSSMMMAAGYDKSNLWQTMRRHQVDIYFAGEVHATTLSKDPASNLVQLVTDRNMPTMITVHDDRLELQCFNRSLNEDGSVLENPLHEEHCVTILKSGDTVKFLDGRGVLKPLNTDALFIHYTFDDFTSTKSPTKLVTIPNHGELDLTFDARARDVKSVPGKLGNALSNPSADSFVDVHGTGPFGFFDRTDRTLALWFKTDNSGRHNLICAGSGMKGAKKGTSAWLDLGLSDGQLFVRTDAGESPVTSPGLNDNRWHHAALVVEPSAASIGHIRVYVDGRPSDFAPSVDTSQAINLTMSIYGISLGGAHRPVWSKSKRATGVPTILNCHLDDFAAWYRVLSSEEIHTLYTSGNTRQMNASEVDRSFSH